MPRSFSFALNQRIRKRIDFQCVFRKKRRLYSPYYIIYYHTNTLKHSRMGVIVSKRSVSHAVQRSRVKRMVREVFRLQQAQLGAVDVVLVARKKASVAKKEELKQCLEQLFAKLSPSL